MLSGKEEQRRRRGEGSEEGDVMSTKAYVIRLYERILLYHEMDRGHDYASSGVGKHAHWETRETEHGALERLCKAEAYEHAASASLYESELLQTLACRSYRALDGSGVAHLRTLVLRRKSVADTGTERHVWECGRGGGVTIYVDWCTSAPLAIGVRATVIIIL